jgi:hypothetical protein
MQITAAEYDELTGRIVIISGYPDEETLDLNRQEGVGMYLDYVDPVTHYIDLTDPENPTPTERPASPVTRTDLTLHDVPNGATLWINGVSYPAEGEVELQFTLPGTYSLRVECFPYLDWTDEVVIP